MAEVAGIVGSALSIVGLAGQILQGCENVRIFLDSIKDASNDIRLLRTEIKMFLSFLEIYKFTLGQVDWSEDEEWWELARLALDYSDEAVTKLQSLVIKLDNRKCGGWSDARFLMKKTKIEKHLGRIEKAKGYILASRTSLSFIHELKRSGLHQDTKQTMRAISALNAKANATANIISSVPNHLKQVCSTTLETKEAIESLTRSVSEEFTRIPAGVNKMLEDTLRKTIQDSHGHSVMHRTYPGSSELSANHTNPQGSMHGEAVLPGQRFVKQQRGRISISTWLGVIIIHSTLIKVQNTSSQNGLEICSGAAEIVRILYEVTITPCLLQSGLFCSFIRNRIPKSSAGFDMKLRVYNCVNETSPIILACRDANLERVQELLGEGKASPFDRLRSGESLLDIILRQMVLLPMRQDPQFALKKLEKLYLLFTMMTNHGLDPGQLWSLEDNQPCGSPLAFFASFCFYITAEFVPVILNTTRTIIEHSIQDPYSAADFTDLLCLRQNVSRLVPSPGAPILQLVEHQERWQPEWVIKEEFTPLFEGQEPEDLGPYDAAGFRTWIRHGVEQRELLMAARDGFQSRVDTLILGGIPESILNGLHYSHLVALLEHGVDPQDDRDGPSLLSLYQQVGKLYPLRAALLHLHWDDNDITEVFEADFLGSLVFQLAHLERRVFRGLLLSAELQFQSIPHTDWNSYIAGLDSRSTIQSTFTGPRGVPADDTHISSVSMAAQQRFYAKNQPNKAERQIRTILNGFIVLMIFGLGIVLGALLHVM